MARDSRKKLEEFAAAAAKRLPATDRHSNATPQAIPRAAAPAEDLKGYIDGADANRITGWIWKPLQPAEPIAIHLLEGNTRLARVLANQYRSDLRQAGIGDGRHAY